MNIDISRRTLLAGAMVAAAATSTASAAAGKHRGGKIKKILILGAGFAGLAAAQEAKRLGIEPIVIEARKRLGGRAFTEDVHGIKIDLGASWLHSGFDNPLRDVAHAHAIPFREAYYSSLTVVPDGTGKPISAIDLFRRSGGNEKLYTLFASELGGLKDGQQAPSVGKIWSQFEIAANDKIASDFMRNVTEQRFAAELDEVSLRAVVSETSLSSDTHFLPHGEALMTGGMQPLAETFAQGLDIRLEHEVLSIDWRDRHVLVNTSKGEFLADAAVITFPLGVLKASPELFRPRLPTGHQSAITHLEMGILAKVALIFPETLWPYDEEYRCSVSPEDLIQTVVNLAAYGKGPAVMGLANGASSKVIEAMDEAEVAKRFKAQLERMYRITLPAPKAVRVTRWSRDPFARGSYAYGGLDYVGNEGMVLSTPIDGKIILAGEAYTPTDPHTVHGAAASGVHAVRQLIDMGVPINE